MEKKRNLWVIPTDKPSRLGYIFDNLILNSKLLSPTLYKNQNIYITDNSEIREGDWHLYENEIKKTDKKTLEYINSSGDEGFLKIILSTDIDPIKDGVQAIDDEFLEWFVKNPSCEEVEVKRNYLGSKCLKCGFIENHDEVDTENCPKCSNTRYEHLYLHKIIIPREEPKQYPIGGYAPGFYSCTCVTCKEEFQGHKRATQCEHCDIKMTQKESKNICPKCRTTDFETCHSIKCPMRKEEPTLDQIYEKALEMESKKQQKYDEMLAMLEELINLHELGHEIGQYDKAKQLIKEAKKL
jgi:Zn finger protein HypA/HybF involved in hydrogenase expression